MKVISIIRSHFLAKTDRKTKRLIISYVCEYGRKLANSIIHRFYIKCKLVQSFGWGIFHYLSKFTMCISSAPEI